MSGVLPSLAELSLAWSAAFGFTSAHYLVLWRIRREEREYLAYALFAAALALNCVGTAVALAADSLARAATGQTIMLVTGIAALASFLDLIHHLVYAGTPPPRVARTRTLGRLFCAVAIGLILAGWAVDPALPVPEAPQIRLPGAVRYVATMTPLGSALLIPALLLAAGEVWMMRDKARADRDVRAVMIGTSVGIVAGVHDIAVWSSWIASTYLLPHFAAITLLTIAWVLVGRVMRTHADLARRTAELSNSSDALRHADEELVRAEQLAAVGELSAVIAHELRAPLAAAKEAVAGLRREGLAEGDSAALLGILDQESDRLNRLVQDLLAYARPPAPQPRRITPAELVQRAMDLARKSAVRSGHVQLEVKLDNAPESLHADADMLAHALENVLTNAIEAMPGGGTIEVRAEPATLDGREAVTLVVRDTGEGMDTLVRSRARDLFFTTRPSGTGLGLAIVERAVRAHGGKLEIDSGREEGTTVKITLPHRRPTAPP